VGAVISNRGLDWLLENGPGELELLFRAIVFQPGVPILLVDNDRRSRDVSVGVSKLLGLPRDKLIGQRLDDFAEPDFKPVISERWRAFLDEGHQEGILKLVDPLGSHQDVGYIAKKDVLPVRHLLVLSDKTANPQGADAAESKSNEHASTVPAWVKDYALCLLDVEGSVVAWYAGSERLYGYNSAAAVGQHSSFLYGGLHPSEDTLQIRLQDELNRAAAAGHVGTEGWQARQDGSRFWANSITMALKDDKGALQGFARVVRDFSDRHERDEKLRRTRAKLRLTAAEPTIAGVASGEFDRAPEINDALLDMLGYSRRDAASGRLIWQDLTPTEYAAQDELAHEECLRFGACTPYQKEMIRKDGVRVPVLIATAVLKLSPFRWITFVQDLRAQDRIESVEEDEVETSEGFGEMVGSSSALKRVIQQAALVAPTDATVLILGETGTGKELVARAVHRMSPRRSLPFITLNCAAIPTGLLESELFGYERGAFTGALSQKIGRFEMAHRGTLFLDEVGDIPLDLQPKLLRALQEKSFERLGGTRTIPIDVRLVAATNRNLTEMMGNKLFRSDLYYRLKVFPITMPPLRDRPEDIPILARHFTKKYAAKMIRQIDKISAETLTALASWHWPGNVRELENFIERSVILSRGPSLRAPLAEIRPDMKQSGNTATLEQVERDHILRVLRESGGVVTTAATRLGLHRTTLNAMMRKLGISRKDL
jgi:formate hydrogenlyase transcriptional activator